MRNLVVPAALKQKLIILTALSFVLSLAIELYVFGFPDDFFTRWLRTFFVVLYLTAMPVLGIVPLVNFIFRRWFR